MKDTDYIQCKLICRDGNIEYTTYIPVSGAGIGRTMNIEGKNGRWEVVEVYKDTRLTEEAAKRASREYRVFEHLLGDSGRFERIEK